MTPRKALFALVTLLSALPASAGERWFKDRVRFEGLPDAAKTWDEGAALQFTVVPQGKYKWGWMAVTYPDGTVESFEKAEVKNGKAKLSLAMDKGKGKYVVEFLVEGELGPAVGAIFHYWCGVPVEEDKETDYAWDPRTAEAIEEDVFKRITEFRDGLKLPRVAWDQRCADLGRDHCADMIENRFFAHVSPKHGDLAARAKVKYGWKNVTWGVPDRAYVAKPDGPVFIGEDIAFDNNPAAAMEAWLGSPGHRAVFMNRFVTHLGVGVKKMEQMENGFLVRRIYIVAAFAYFADSNIEKAEQEAAARALEAKAWPQLQKAEDLESRDAPAAVDLYDDIAGRWPETPSGIKAAARAKELRERPDWPDIVKAATARREARQWLERARMLIDNKRPESARTWLDKVLEAHPGTPEAEDAARLKAALPE